MLNDKELLIAAFLMTTVASLVYHVSKLVILIITKMIE